MPTKMTMADVADWAISRGFVWVGGRVLSIPYKDGAVCLELMARNLRVVARCRGRETRLSTVSPSRLHIDADGVLQGAGLSNSFLQRCHSAADVPPWYPEAAAAKARAWLDSIHAPTSAPRTETTPACPDCHSAHVGYSHTNAEDDRWICRACGHAFPTRRPPHED